MKKLVVLLIFVFAVTVKFSHGEGNCKTPGNKMGMCIPIAQCHYLNDLANTRPPPPNAEAFVKAHHCNEGEPIVVCCALEAISNKSENNSPTPSTQDGPMDSVSQLEDKLIESTKMRQGDPNGDTSTRFQFPNFNNIFQQFQFPSFNSPNYGFVNPNFGAFGNPFNNFYNRQVPSYQQPYSPPYSAPNQGYTAPNQGYNQPMRQIPATAPAPVNNQYQNPAPLAANNQFQHPSSNLIGCGTEIVGNRILNGEDAEENEFPWVALLEYRRYDNSLVIACAGSLISPQYVLSAGHCVTGKILRNIGPLVNVRLGDWDTNINENCGTFCQRWNGVETITPHPEYVDGNINHLHDIALIRLKRKALITNSVRTICLPAPNSQLETGERLYAAGFGRTLEAAKSAIKQKIQLPIYDQNRCKTKFSEKRVAITNNHLCAGGELNRDTCDGDSGGPLMKFKTNWIIEGITSFGDSRCGREDLPGVYTRVSNYLDWIRNTMRP